MVLSQAATCGLGPNTPKLVSLTVVPDNHMQLLQRKQLQPGYQHPDKESFGPACLSCLQAFISFPIITCIVTFIFTFVLTISIISPSCCGAY